MYKYFSQYVAKKPARMGSPVGFAVDNLHQKGHEAVSDVEVVAVEERRHEDPFVLFAILNLQRVHAHLVQGVRGG